MDVFIHVLPLNPKLVKETNSFGYADSVAGIHERLRYRKPTEMKVHLKHPHLSGLWMIGPAVLSPIRVSGEPK